MNSLHNNHAESPYKVSKSNQTPTQNTHTDTNIKLLNKVLIQNLQSLQFKLYIYRQKIICPYLSIFGKFIFLFILWMSLFGTNNE